MNDYFEPELGQAVFGQPYKQYNASNLLEAALRAIDDNLCTAMWNVNQEKYNSPFSNTGNVFECDTFKVAAYSWGDDEQPWNFKWRGIEVSWYKYLGRGMSVNKVVTYDEVAEMLDDCLKAIWKLEGPEWPTH